MYITDDGIRLNAKLDMPAEHGDKCPLVIVIHGFTGHMEERHITAVSQTLNECGFATLRVDMYGHGHSDTVMLAGAMKHDVITGLIPLSPAWMIPEEARKGTLLGRDFDPDRIPDMLGDWGERGLGGNYIRVAQTIHVEDAIDRYDGPVLIVHGDEDEAVPVEYGIRAAERYRDCKLVLIPGDTHCYDYHLDQVLNAVREWMQGRC